MILTANGPLLTGTGPLYAPYAAPPAAVARTPNPISDSQIHSGHSLTDGGVAGGNGFPNQHYGQFIDTIDGSTPDVTIETVPGSSMTFRRENVSSDAWVNMANYQIISTIERNDAYPDAIFVDPAPWVVDEQTRIRSEMALWFSRSQTLGNGGAGADFFFFTPWGAHGDFNSGAPAVTVTSWRERLGYDEQFYLDVATFAEQSHGSGTVWIIPGSALMIDLYDQAEAGNMPGIADGATFLASSDWWLDNVHQGDFLKLAHAYLHAYVIHHVDPRGQAYTGFGLTDEPSATVATFIQNRVYNLIQNYPRAGVVV